MEGTNRQRLDAAADDDWPPTTTGRRRLVVLAFKVKGLSRVQKPTPLTIGRIPA
jgi:hypothetical protein